MSCALIFAAAVATMSGQDSPHLIAQPNDKVATPLVRPMPDFPAEALGDFIITTVTMAFDVEADGQVTNFSLEGRNAALIQPQLAKAVADWRYQPALVRGKPVARRGLQLQLVFNTRDRRPLRIVDEVRAPSVARLHLLEHPESLMRQRLIGKVLVEGTITERGRVKNARVLDTPHPAISQAALACFEKSVFHPGTLDGQPIRCVVKKYVLVRPPGLRLNEQIMEPQSLEPWIEVIPHVSYDPANPLPPVGGSYGIRRW